MPTGSSTASAPTTSTATCIARSRPSLRAPARPETEREGFEPSDEVDPRHTISSRARSAAPAPLLEGVSVAADPLREDLVAAHDRGLDRVGDDAVGEQPAAAVDRVELAVERVDAVVAVPAVEHVGGGAAADHVVAVVAEQLLAAL